MPHERARHALPLILKKLSFSRVVTLQGARQTGKSFIAREVMPSQRKNSTYVTLDSTHQRTFASRSPATFLAGLIGFSPAIIDEVQKSPELFDEIKLLVDANPKPGQFLLLGSTEFSHETKIRESLTGRVSKIEIFPFNLGEANVLGPNASNDFSLLNVKPRLTRGQFLKHIESGGLPGIFAVRDTAERDSLLTSWLRLVTERDLMQIKTLKLDSDLAADLLTVLPKLKEPDVTSIAGELRTPVRRVQSHLKALQLLFVIRSLPPNRLGSGKPHFFLTDLGVARQLGQSLYQSVRHALLLEQWSQRSYRLDPPVRNSYYRSSRGKIIDLIVEDPKGIKPTIAIKTSDSEKMDLREFQILYAFQKKSKTKTRLIYLAPVAEYQKIEGVEVYPWEAMG